jgi:hypothetical protein
LQNRQKPEGLLRDVCHKQMNKINVAEFKSQPWLRGWEATSDEEGV